MASKGSKRRSSVFSTANQFWTECPAENQGVLLLYIAFSILLPYIQTSFYIIVTSSFLYKLKNFVSYEVRVINLSKMS